MPPTVGVVGASARAAVHSLARAGFAAWAVDLFADRDLKRVAPCSVCLFEAYPDAIPALATQFPPGPVLYTGGLENHPEVVRTLAATRELWGNTPDVLRQVREPYILSRTLWGKGFAYPRLAEAKEACPTPGRWLRKPLRSSGGHGIRFARPGELHPETHYFQEFIDGPPMSALFLANHTKVELVGATEQLIGESWLHASQFGYAGNLGPIELTAILRSELTHLGHVLATELGVRGVFGVDFVLHDGSAWVIEVNPRYPASAEVLEHGTGCAVFANGAASARRYSAVGKAIYYAPHRIAFPQSGPWDADLAHVFDPWRLPGFADIPEPGSVIETGWPVLTIFATGSSPAECRERLQLRAAELDHLFAEATP